MIEHIPYNIRNYRIHILFLYDSAYHMFRSTRGNPYLHFFKFYSLINWENETESRVLHIHLGYIYPIIYESELYPYMSKQKFATTHTITWDINYYA